MNTIGYLLGPKVVEEKYDYTSLSEMAAIAILILIVGGLTITMPSVCGGPLAWIRPGLTGLLAESFHQGVGTACIFSRALVIDCDSLPVLYFTLTSWHAFLEMIEMNGHGDEQSSTVQRHLTGQKSLR